MVISWYVVGVHYIPATAIRPNRKNTLHIPRSDQFDVEIGDVIGLAFYDDNPLIASQETDTENAGTALWVGFDTVGNDILTNIDEIVVANMLFNSKPIRDIYPQTPTSFLVSFSATVQVNEPEGRNVTIRYHSVKCDLLWRKSPPTF